MDEKLRLALGDAARAARLRLGLTQAEVAKKVRLKSGVYGRVERGMMTPSVPTLRRMCETLGISSDGLAPVTWLSRSLCEAWAHADDYTRASVVPRPSGRFQTIQENSNSRRSQ